MEHQKILNLLNDANDSKFVTRKWNAVNDNSKANYYRLRKLLEEHSTSTEALRNIVNSRFFKIICFKVLTALRQENTKQLTCKNKKLHHLKIKFNKLPKDKYNIPVLN